MPSSGEHRQPLRLLCGPDGALVAGEYAVATLCIFLTALGELDWEGKLFLAAAVLAILRLLPETAVTGPLLLRPAGSYECAGSSGQVASSAWVSRRYTVIRLDAGFRRRHVVISASRQPPGEYRKLLSWLRLGRWRTED